MAHDEVHDEVLAAWLVQAYEMERQVAADLEAHARESPHLPAFQQRLKEHLAQTHHHADLIKSCAERHGGKPPALKVGLAAATGLFQSLSFGQDERERAVQNGISDYAAEHLEIATYRGIIAAADELDDPETAQACREILRDEEEMADWLGQHLAEPMTPLVEELARGH